MFGFRSKKNEYRLPASLNNILSESDYNDVVNLSLVYFKNNSYVVSKVLDGIIYVQDNHNEIQCSLDNLARQIATLEKSSWANEIGNHFNKLKENTATHNYFFDDYEATKQYLKLVIKAKGSLPGDQIRHFIFRIDLPETCTFLVFDFEEKFHFLTVKQVESWGQSIDTLFGVAIENISKEHIDAREVYLKEQKLYALFSSDFSAPFVIDLKNNATLAIGKYGSLVCIPTKGTVFICPIDDYRFTDILGDLYEEVIKFFNEDPGNITTNLYWYYNDSYNLFPQQTEGEQLIISLPDKLNELLKSN